MESTEFKLSERGIKVSEYQMLRNTTDWPAFDIQAIEEALEKDLFSVCVTHKGQVVGMGRIVGDGVLYFYIQDVIVLPEYRGRGVGEIVMRSLENFIDRNGHTGSFVGLMAASGVKDFYKKYGYRERPNDRPGMYRII